MYIVPLIVSSNVTFGISQSIITTFPPHVCSINVTNVIVCYFKSQSKNMNKMYELLSISFIHNIHIIKVPLH